MREIFLQGYILSTLGDDALGRTIKAPYELCGWHYCDLCDASKNPAAAAYASKVTQVLFFLKN
jgi:hypothetical protein